MCSLPRRRLTATARSASCSGAPCWECPPGRSTTGLPASPPPGTVAGARSPRTFRRRLRPGGAPTLEHATARGSGPLDAAAPCWAWTRTGPRPGGGIKTPIGWRIRPAAGAGSVHGLLEAERVDIVELCEAWGVGGGHVAPVEPGHGSSVCHLVDADRDGQNQSVVLARPDFHAIRVPDPEPLL